MNASPEFRKFSKLSQLVLVAACIGAHAFAQAQTNLSPGSGVAGGGNLHGGQPYAPEPGSFYRDHSFFISWQDQSVAPSQRFTDIVGQAGSVWRSPSTGESPYTFTGVELFAAGSGNLLDSYSFNPSADPVHFTFSRLLEGEYTLRIIGTPVPSPDGWWPVNEWQYSFSAVASPAPEASTLAMGAMGLIAVVAWARRQRRAPRTGA